jgi:TonB family protein
MRKYYLVLLLSFAVLVAGLNCGKSGGVGDQHVQSDGDLKYDTPPVPTLNLLTGRGEFDSARIATSMNYLEYQDSMAAPGAVGKLELLATVSSQGFVKEVRVLNDEAFPDGPKRQAMKRIIDCAFTPATLKSKAVTGTIDIPMFLRRVNIPKPSPEDFLPVDEQPTPLSTKQPAYPEIARRAGIEGVVWVKAFISEEGAVAEVIVWKNTSGSVDIANAAIDAIRQWKFKPAVVQKKNVAVWAVIPFRFKLQN